MVVVQNARMFRIFCVSRFVWLLRPLCFQADYSTALGYLSTGAPKNDESFGLGQDGYPERLSESREISS